MNPARLVGIKVFGEGLKHFQGEWTKLRVVKVAPEYMDAYKPVFAAALWDQLRCTVV
jgi:hypothetical protein